MRNLLRQWKRRNARQRGQVLIYIVILLVILLVMALFMFDLQYFIRLRSRSQTAVDSAVLTAAGWQGRSLNMIGELNLVKASTLMLADVLPTDDATMQAAKVMAEDQLISEMQTRITYVGPLLGYLAAQQAAKNNGMRPVDEFTNSMAKHLGSSFDDTFGGNQLYMEIYKDQIPYFNYDWTEGYRTMLLMLITEKLAVKVVNTRYLAGQPLLIGEGAALLMDPAFYSAVQTKNYCWFINRSIFEADVFDFGNMDVEDNPSAYFPGSEFLNLYVKFQQSAVNLTTLQPYLDDRSLTPIDPSQPGYDQISWAIFDNAGHGWTDTSSYSYINQYLRSPFREEYTYGGAATRMFCEAQPSLLTGRWSWKYGEEEVPSDSLGDELQWSSTDFGNNNASFQDYGERMSGAEKKLENLRNRQSVYSSAAAKPFGSLDTGVGPHEAGIVLPVFDEVRLIPAALVNENVFDRNYRFYEFIVDYFGHPDYPDVPDEILSKYRSYIKAIKDFEDHSSNFHGKWADFEAWREEYMKGDDGEAGTADDRKDPCLPVFTSGGGGGGSQGGPSILH